MLLGWVFRVWCWEPSGVGSSRGWAWNFSREILRDGPLIMGHRSLYFAFPRTGGNEVAV